MLFQDPAAAPFDGQSSNDGDERALLTLFNDEAGRLFFGGVILLWAAILATLIGFWKRSKWAGGLLVPYLAWVSFAAVLNVAIWRLNA